MRERETEARSREAAPAALNTAAAHAAPAPGGSKPPLATLIKVSTFRRYDFAVLSRRPLHAQARAHPLNCGCACVSVLDMTVKHSKTAYRVLNIDIL